MKLIKAEKQNLEKIVDISKRAFETDIEVGGVHWEIILLAMIRLSVTNK